MLNLKAFPYCPISLFNEYPKTPLSNNRFFELLPSMPEVNPLPWKEQKVVQQSFKFLHHTLALHNLGLPQFLGFLHHSPPQY
jgi:hypothetical protein